MRGSAYTHLMATPDHPQTQAAREPLGHEQERGRTGDLAQVAGGILSLDAVSASVGEPHVSSADREIHDKAAAYDALLDALGDDMDRRLAEINATLNRLAA